MLSEFKKPVTAHVRVIMDVHCPVCGASFDDITRSGKVGCAECYRTFYENLAPMLQRLHGGATHCGKVPGYSLAPSRPAGQLSVMRRALREAIDTQNFEYAATLRDQIRMLESEVPQHDEMV